jgi:hypothetical protein
VRHGRVPGGHHDARLSGGPRPRQATPLRSVRFAAGGLDRTAAPPGARNYVMSSRLTVAHDRNESVHPRRSRGVMIRSRERRNRRPRRGKRARTRRKLLRRTSASTGSHARSTSRTRTLCARVGGARIGSIRGDSAMKVATTRGTPRTINATLRSRTSSASAASSPRQRWTVVQEFTDHAISGATRRRRRRVHHGRAQSARMLRRPLEGHLRQPTHHQARGGRGACSRGASGEASAPGSVRRVLRRVHARDEPATYAASRQPLGRRA